jgi:WD40 repeat protein
MRLTRQTNSRLGSGPIFSFVCFVLLVAFLTSCTPESAGPTAPTGLSSSDNKSTADVATLVAQLPEPVPIWAVDFRPDGKYLATFSPSVPHEIHIWDWRNKTIVRKLSISGFVQTADLIRYSPNGRLLAFCGDLVKGDHRKIVSARVWNADTGEIVQDVETPGGGSCTSIDFTPDGKFFVWSGFPSSIEKNVIVFSTETWQPVWGLHIASFSPKTLSVSPDGKMIAIGGSVTTQVGMGISYRILLIDMAQHAIMRTIQVASDNVTRLAWSPDSGRVAVGGRGGDGKKQFELVQIFDTISGEMITSEKAKYSRIQSLRYTMDGKYLIEASLMVDEPIREDSRLELLRFSRGDFAMSIRIWDGQHRRLLQQIPGEAGGMAVTRDGRYLAMGGDRMDFIFELK